MLTVFLECQDNEPELAQTLSVLVSAAVEGLVRDVVVLDRAAREGTSRIADAAGCRYYAQWEIAEILRAARGDWLLFVEPGARPQSGWIDEVSEYMTVGNEPARFTAARGYRRPLLKRFARARSDLELGLLISKDQAMDRAKSGMGLADFVKGRKPRRLSAEIIPAWVARSAIR